MTVPAFFVPAATAENQETVYGQLAATCGVAPPRGADRIYSIVFENHGEEWTATVGESLRGVRTRRVKQKGKTLERKENLRDRAVVLAIFPGASYRVVTTHGANRGSAFHNPIEAGPPRTITKFSAANDHQVLRSGDDMSRKRDRRMVRGALVGRGSVEGSGG